MFDCRRRGYFETLKGDAGNIRDEIYVLKSWKKELWVVLSFRGIKEVAKLRRRLTETKSVSKGFACNGVDGAQNIYFYRIYKIYILGQIDVNKPSLYKIHSRQTKYAFWYPESCSYELRRQSLGPRQRHLLEIRNMDYSSLRSTAMVRWGNKPNSSTHGFARSHHHCSTNFHQSNI